MKKVKKSEIRKKVEAVLDSTSAIPNRSKIQKALKGTSPYREQIEKIIYREPSKHGWMIIGKLAFNVQKLINIEGDKEEGINSLSRVFQDERDYSFILSLDDANRFNKKGTYEDYIEVKGEDIAKKKYEKNIMNFIDKIQEIKPEFEMDEEIEEKVLSFYQAIEVDYLEKSVKYVELQSALQTLSLNKGQIREAVGIDSKGSSLLEYRAELYHEFIEDKEIVEKLRKVSAATVEKAKKIKNRESKRDAIIKGRDNK